MGGIKSGAWALIETVFVSQAVDESEMAKYRRKLRDWYTERERQLQEFTITEKDLVPAVDKKHSASTSNSKKSPKINRSPEQPYLYTAEPKGKAYKADKVHAM